MKCHINQTIRSFVLLLITTTTVMSATKIAHYPYRFYGDFSSADRVENWISLFTEIGIKYSEYNGDNVYERIQLDKVSLNRDFEKQLHIRDTFPLFPGADISVHGVIIKEGQYFIIRIFFFDKNGKIVHSARSDVKSYTLSHMEKSVQNLYKEYYKLPSRLWKGSNDKNLLMATAQAIQYADNEEYEKALATLEKIAKEDVGYGLVPLLIDDITRRIIRNLQAHIWFNQYVFLFTPLNDFNTIPEARIIKEKHEKDSVYTKTVRIGRLNLFTYQKKFKKGTPKGNKLITVKDIKRFRPNYEIKQRGVTPSLYSGLSFLGFGAGALMYYDVHRDDGNPNTLIPGHILAGLSGVSLVFFSNAYIKEKKVSNLQIKRGKWSPYVESYGGVSSYFYGSPKNILRAVEENLPLDNLEWSSDVQPKPGFSLDYFVSGVGYKIGVVTSHSRFYSVPVNPDSAIVSDSTLEPDDKNQIEISPTIFTVGLKKYAKKRLQENRFCPYLLADYEYYFHGVTKSGDDSLFVDVPDKFELHSLSPGVGLSFLFFDDFLFWGESSYRIPVGGNLKELEPTHPLHGISFQAGFTFLLPKHTM